MRQRTWKALDCFPASDTVEHFYLESDGHAASLHGDGRLVGEQSDKNTSNALLLDPRNPVPVHGGNSLVADQESGMFDQRAIQSRDDVLVFTSKPLSEDINISGLVQAKIWASSPTTLLDLFIRVSDVHPDGSAYDVVDAMQRKKVTKDEPVCMTIDFNYTDYSLQDVLKLIFSILIIYVYHSYCS